jgi:hypothetical protein
MAIPGWKKITSHIDREEIISKLAIGIEPADIHDWLAAKYSLGTDKKFVISTVALKSFKENYFDFYKTITEDFGKTKTALATGTPVDSLELAVKGNTTYQGLLVDTINTELNLKTTISRLVASVDMRLGQVHDIIQDEYYNDPRNINTKIDYVLLAYVEALSPLLERANKIINEAPDQVIQHNITVQHIDQQVAIFYEAIRKVLSRMDLDIAMGFMEDFNEALNALKSPTNGSAARLSEVKALNSTINATLMDTQ